MKLKTTNHPQHPNNRLCRIEDELIPKLKGYRDAIMLIELEIHRIKSINPTKQVT